MGREEHLTRPKQYAVVYSEGRSWANSLLVMKAVANGLSLSRYGFSVSKKVGTAVTRNRVRRLLREILRLTPIKPGWDIVFISRSAAATAGYTSLKESVEGLLFQARLR